MSTIDDYTYPPAPELRAAAFHRPGPRDHWALREMSWCQEHFGFAIADAGRGGPLDRYAVYTVGLAAHGNPEFVIIGQPPETAHLVVTSLARGLVHSEDFNPEVLGGCDDEYGEVPVLSVQVEEGFSAREGAQGLNAKLVELSLEMEDVLFPGGLFRHPTDERRYAMLQVILPEAQGLGDLVPEQPTEAPVRSDEPDLVHVPRPLEEIVRAEGQLTDRVWYYRTLRLEMELLERGYVCPEHGHDCELEALRELSAPGRRRIEATFSEPGELGPNTEFELGMLHGKLSALRWVLGRHWDFLDLT